MKSSPPLRLLVFAHTPPPHHGQSYMVELLLRELRQDGTPEVQVFHVNSRLSNDLSELGKAGVGKLWRLLGYCARALWLRWRHGADILYYVPAPGQRAALVRDWLVMALCRPWFRRTVFHWHASGLGHWLETQASVPERALSKWLLGKPDLSLVLAGAVAADDEIFFRPRRVRVVPNGIPDPCPDYDAALRQSRRARAEARAAALAGADPGAIDFRILFLAHCARDKGLHDTLAAAANLGRALPAAIRVRLTVAGKFLSDAERIDFLQAAAAVTEAVEVGYIGFAAGAEKDELLRTSDCFCFPTYYTNEVMPVALIEALAYGLPIVTTRWRAIPEMLPAADSRQKQGYWLVEPQRPDEVADSLREAMVATDTSDLRSHFLANFQLSVFGQRVRNALAELR